MAMMASVVPYSLELAAMRRTPKRVFGILLSLEPAVATMAGWLLLGQHAPPAALAAVGAPAVLDAPAPGHPVQHIDPGEEHRVRHRAFVEREAGGLIEVERGVVDRW